MATLGELRDIISENIEDDDFQAEEIERYINHCLSRVANAVLLPSLETSEQVQTVPGSSYIHLPASYNRGLFSCVRSDGSPVDVLPSTLSIRRQYPLFDSTPIGDVVCCAVQGRKLAITNVPRTESLLFLSFYSKPPVLGEDDSLDDILPDIEQQENLVLHYVLSTLWKRIEDGIDGALVNTRFHQGMFLAALDELESSLIGEGINYAPPPRGRGDNI